MLYMGIIGKLYTEHVILVITELILLNEGGYFPLRWRLGDPLYQGVQCNFANQALWSMTLTDGTYHL